MQALVAVVYQKYPHLFPEFQLTFKAQQVTEKTVGIVRKKGKRLRKEVDDISPEILLVKDYSLQQKKRNM